MPKGGDAILAISLEDVLDYLNVAVVVEREIHVRAADKVDGRALADRAADCEAELFGSGREEEKGRREDGLRSVLGVAEEAPGPVPRPDPPCGQVKEVTGCGFDPSRHQVEELRPRRAERRPVQVVVGDEPFVLTPAAAREDDPVDGRM